MEPKRLKNATIVQYTYDKFEAGTYMIRVTAVDEAQKVPLYRE